MRFRRLLKQTARAMRGGLMAAAGLAFLVAAVGVPLPARRVKDRSVAFPCMDRPCGCHDAAGCKAHCCCFTSEEKLAWADEHDVDPTPFVDDVALAKIQLAKRVLRLAVHEEPHADCCRKKVAASCCSHAGVKHVDSSRHAEAKRGPQGFERRGDANSDSLVTIAAYRQCHGLQPLWTLLGAALPPPKPVQCEFEFLLTGRVADRVVSLTLVAFSPPIPPPRA